MARNEAAVREEVIAPILAALGYRSGTDNHILYELSIAYPHNFLGRKKTSDPVLRGKADYVCRAGDIVSWVIEAKPEDPGISPDDVQQAYTYARHPEVRGLYFCLCDGKEFRVYATAAAPETGPIRTIDPKHPHEAADALRSLLGPEALRRQVADAIADSQPSIGPGLKSFAQIVGGQIAYDDEVPVAQIFDGQIGYDDKLPIKTLRGFTIHVVGGAIQRHDNGGLHAYWESSAPYASIQRVIESMGLTRIDTFSTASMLSDSTSAPTTFEMINSVGFAEGQLLLNLETHEEVGLPKAVQVSIHAAARGALRGDKFAGRLELRIAYAQDGGLSFLLPVNGTFSLTLR